MFHRYLNDYSSPIYCYGEDEGGEGEQLHTCDAHTPITSVWVKLL